MIRDLVVWSGKVLFNMVMWIFILSLEWGGRSLYDRGYEILIDNAVVEAADREVHALWEKVKTTAVVTFAKLNAKDSNKEQENQ